MFPVQLKKKKAHMKRSMLQDGLVGIKGLSVERGDDPLSVSLFSLLDFFQLHTRKKLAIWFHRHPTSTFP